MLSMCVSLLLARLRASFFVWTLSFSFRLIVCVCKCARVCACIFMFKSVSHNNWKRHTASFWGEHCSHVFIWMVFLFFFFLFFFFQPFVASNHIQGVCLSISAQPPFPSDAIPVYQSILIDRSIVCWPIEMVNEKNTHTHQQTAKQHLVICIRFEWFFISSTWK